MESFDPPMNNANAGKSSRRISSILKAPRTSVHSAEPEHVETPVPVAMPVEKRNSRRVSFAPATDVLLFSKEKRNGSPVRSPLQDLSAPNTPDNRNPVGVTAKGVHLITDMETLLNAPLQTSRQTKEVLMASRDAGEKTTMFSADDSAMDLTHSHTVLISNDSDAPDQHGETASMDFFFSSSDRGKAEPCSLPKMPSSSVQHFDPEFEQLLASMSKPTVPRDNSVTRKVETSALMMPFDKENQAPTLRATKRESVPHRNEQIGESSNRGVVPSADDPFQCFFPTLDLYRRTEQREPVERNGRPQFFEAPEFASSKPTAKISVADSKSLRLGMPTLKLGNSLTQTRPEDPNRTSSGSDDMDMTRSQTVAIDSRSVHTLTKQPEISRLSITTPYRVGAGFEHDMDFTRCQTGIIEAKHLDLGKLPYTANAGIMADSQWDRPLNQGKITMDNFEMDNMEITQSQTAAIESLHGGKPLQMSENLVKPTAKWNYPSEDDAMEFTACHTNDVDLPVGHVSTLDLKKSLPVEDYKINWRSQTERSDVHDMESDDMEMTRSQTVAIDAKSLNVAVSTSQDKKRASMAFMSAFTKAFTHNPSQKESDRDMTTKQSNTSLIFDSSVHAGASQRDGFASSNCESDDMEMTKSQTVAIDAKTLNVVDPSDYKRRKSLAFPTATDHKSQPSGSSMPGKRLGSCFSQTEPALDTDMDLTRSQTGLIEVKPLDSGNPSLIHGSAGSSSVLDPKTTFKGFSEARRMGATQILAQYNCEADDMEMTKSQTVAIDTNNLNPLPPVENKRKSLAFRTAVEHISEPSVWSNQGVYSGGRRSRTDDADADMELTRSQTTQFELKPQISSEEARAAGREGSEQYSCEADDMEMTKSQTVAIDARDLNAVNPSDYKRRKSLAFPTATDHKSQPSGSSMPGKRLGSFFSQTEPALDTDMDLTRSQTGLIEVKPLDSGNPSLIHGSEGSSSVLDPKTTFKGFSEARRMGATQILAQYNCESDDMEMTKIQTVAIDTNNLNPLPPVENKRKSLAFRTAVDHISEPSVWSNQGVYSGGRRSRTDDADADMELTRSQTTQFELKPQISSEQARAAEREGSEQYNCEADDMEMTKSQTVAIDARNLIAVNPLQNKKRKSLAFVAKVDHFPEDGFPSSTEADSEMEFTRCQTRLIETKRLSFVKPSLKINSGKSFPTLDTHLPISTNAEENTKSFNNANIFPESNQENYPDALCSEDMELTRSQTVTLNCKNTGYPSLMFHKERKSLTLVKELSSGIESQSPDDLDIACSQPIVQSADTPGPGHASLQPSGSAGHLDADLNSRSRVSVALADKELTQNGPSIPLNQEAAVCDPLDASQNEVNSSPRSVDSTRNADAHGPSSASMLNKNGSELTEEHPPNSSRGAESPGVSGGDKTSSTRARRMSLVDLQSKLRRMSQLPHEPTQRFAADEVYAPPSRSKPASDRTADHTRLLTAPPRHNPDARGADNANDTQPEPSAEQQRCVTAPLNVNRRNLTSRLSLGKVLPKLPQKIKAADPDRVCGGGWRSVEERDDKVIPRPLGSGGVTDDIMDEVLPNISSDEDLSIDAEGSQCAGEDGPPLCKRDVQGASEEDVWERSPGQPSDPQGKRPPPVEGEGEDVAAAEKRRRVSLNGASETQHPSPEEGTLTGTTAVLTEALDVSKSSRTAHLRSETTLESTLKQSMFESQLEDNKDQSNDFPKNIDDERLTVLEFFKLLNIDFVIHNPRQSILPGKLASHLGHTPEALLKSRHVSLPKQRVYELDHQNLAEQVQRLKARMTDQGGLPLHSVNRPLWEELKRFSQDELKRFGSKMKERSNFFRKRSKAQSHEMKETLYSSLLQAHQEERQKLRGKMEEADGMLRGLDDCIQELEAELAAVEGSGLEDSRPTLKSSQQGLEKVTMEMAERERQLCELETQRRCRLDQVSRLQAEVQDLKGHVTTLHRVNEWRVTSCSAEREVYSFLYGSLILEVVFGTRAAAGGEPAGDRERNVLDVRFTLELDAERSACHARLVHTLLSQFTQGRGHWAQTYPSARCVPKLLHDVSLVVSRCRLLGEEVRALRSRGALRLDLLDVRCEGASVHLVFSSLEAMAKFELTLGVSAAYPSCPLQLQAFRNHVGSTTAQRLEDVVSSVAPGRRYLTRAVQAVHAAVLS